MPWLWLQIKTPPGSSSHQIWQAVRASSAAPYYLDDFKCGNDRSLQPALLSLCQSLNQAGLEEAADAGINFIDIPWEGGLELEASVCSKEVHLAYKSPGSAALQIPGWRGLS